jgi:hypothetical protein
MNTKYMVVIAAIAVMLIGAIAIASEHAFAKKGNSKSRAAAQSNECGNGVLPEQIFSRSKEQIVCFCVLPEHCLPNSGRG